MVVTKPAGNPYFGHDCKECAYVGKDNPRDNEPRGSYVDLYYHPGWKLGTGCLTRRWGSGVKECEVMAMEKYNRTEVKAVKWKGIVDLARKHGHNL
jgi:hypothetical protein